MLPQHQSSLAVGRQLQHLTCPIYAETHSDHRQWSTVPGGTPVLSLHVSLTHPTVEWSLLPLWISQLHLNKKYFLNDIYGVHIYKKQISIYVIIVVEFELSPHLHS